MSNRALTWAQAQTVGSATKKLVLLIVADRASDDDWSTFAGQEAIAAAAELNIRSVRRALAELEEDGVIERSQRRRPDGYRTSDLIRVNMAWEPSDPVDNHTSPDTESGDRESGDTGAGSPMQDHRTQSPGTQSQVTESPRTLTTTSPDCVSDLTGHTVRAEDDPSVDPSVDAAAAGPPDIRTTLDAAAQILAQRRAAKRPDVGAGWIHNAARGIASDYLTRAEQLLDQDPDLLPEQLADILEPPSSAQAKPVTAVGEGLVSAMNVNGDRAQRIAQGEHCGECDGTGWVPGNGGELPCQDCDRTGLASGAEPPPPAGPVVPDWGDLRTQLSPDAALRPQEPA